jgi:dTDP-4-amino-4,6-dideoxygalactose transaminase
MEKIPVFRPLIQDQEIQAATQTLQEGWLGMGKYVGQFEDTLQKVLGAENKHVVAVSTGHAALHLSLMLIGAGPGDEVITPSFNNIADFQAILAVGASPVFCDIDPDTLCIDLDKAEALIGPKTKAIIVMDYDCILCDHDRVAEIAAKHKLRIIHDAAHSIGSSYKGRPVGSFSDICMFSFDPVKTVTCVDGGAIVVGTEEEKQILQEMRLIGMSQPATVMYQNKRAWTYDVSRLGFRYHMANLHAAIGIQQLSKLDEIRRSRVATCEYYNVELSKVSGVRVPLSDFVGISPFLYYIRVSAANRDELRAFLLERGIDTGIHWQPGHWFSLLKDCKAGPLDVTDKVGNEILSLPLHSIMDRQDQKRVVEGVRDYFLSQEGN